MLSKKTKEWNAYRAQAIQLWYDIPEGGFLSYEAMVEHFSELKLLPNTWVFPEQDPPQQIENSDPQALAKMFKVRFVNGIRAKYQGDPEGCSTRYFVFHEGWNPSFVLEKNYCMTFGWGSGVINLLKGVRGDTTDRVRLHVFQNLTPMNDTLLRSTNCNIYQEYVIFKFRSWWATPFIISLSIYLIWQSLTFSISFLVLGLSAWWGQINGRPKKKYRISPNEVLWLNPLGDISEMCDPVGIRSFISNHTDQISAALKKEANRDYSLGISQNGKGYVVNDHVDD